MEREEVEKDVKAEEGKGWEERQDGEENTEK